MVPNTFQKVCQLTLCAVNACRTKPVAEPNAVILERECRRNPRYSSVICLVVDHEDDLRRAEEHVAEARRIVYQQKGRIVRLRAAGADTWDAERALRLFETNLLRFEEHRDILKAKK